MRDTDGNFLGTCTRPDDPQEMDCSQVIAATFMTHAFSCKLRATKKKNGILTVK